MKCEILVLGPQLSGFVFVPFAGLFKKPLFVTTRFHVVIFMLMIFISISITVSRPRWIGCWKLFHPNTWCPRGEGMYGWAGSTSNSSRIFNLNCAPAQSQWLSVVQRGFMKGTRNPLNFPCLLLVDLDVMIFFIRF